MTLKPTRTIQSNLEDLLLARRDISIFEYLARTHCHCKICEPRALKLSELSKKEALKNGFNKIIPLDGQLVQKLQRPVEI